MEPVAAPGFENLWLTTEGQALELRDGELVPLKVSHSSTYSRISVLVDGKRVRFHLHVLMARTFLGLDVRLTGLNSDSLQVDHKDGDKRNNKLENLEVVTKLENYRRARAQGRYQCNGYAGKGRPKLGLRKFSRDDVEAMVDMRSQGLSYREIGCRMGCDHKAVYRILKGDVYQTWD